MTNTSIELSYAQQRSVLNRFNHKADYGTRQQNTHIRAGQYLELHCKMCPPTSEQLGSGYKAFKSSWFCRTEDACRVYARRDRVEPIVLEAHQHLVEKHNVTPCKICFDLITTRGMTRHNKSPACQAELRRHYMREEGFEPLASSIKEIFFDMMRRKKVDLSNQLDWKDYEAHLAVEHASENAAYWFVSQLGVRPAFTAWDVRAKKYDQEFWAPATTATFLNLLDDTMYKYNGDGDTECISTLNQWLEGDDDMKEAILGILELRKDGSE